MWLRSRRRRRIPRRRPPSAATTVARPSRKDHTQARAGQLKRAGALDLHRNFHSFTSGGKYLQDLWAVFGTRKTLAVQQCSSDDVANQILFDTLICESLSVFAAHNVSAEYLLRLSQDFDVVFLWSLAYGNVRTTFNARFIRFPLAIAFPRTVDEVVF